MLDTIRCYKLRLPGPVALLFKALVMCEGLIEQISPDSNMNEFISSLSEKILYQRIAISASRVSISPATFAARLSTWPN